MANPPVYLDSASSEPLHPAAREVLLAAYERGFADPRRRHGPARDARLLLDNARDVVAEALQVRRDEVSFTASGTEAVHRGLLGLAHARRTAGRTVVHTSVEHQAVFHATAWWGESSAVAVDELGRVDPARVRRRASDPAVGAVVAAIQSANHEVGTVQPIADLDLPIPLFVDACASMGRLPLPSGWDAAAGSAHKWGGPGGVGVLLVRARAPWESPFPSDDRVDERTVGFENVPAILAAAAALQAVVAERDEVNARQHRQVDRLRTAIAAMPGATVLGDPENRLPHLVTVAFDGVDGEALIDGLATAGVGAASGSACGASAVEPSRIVAALGALDAATHGNLRLSVARETTDAQVDDVIGTLPRVVAALRSALPQ